MEYGLGFSPNGDAELQKAMARSWFEDLQVSIMDLFERLDREASPALYTGGDAGSFICTPWRRAQGQDGTDQGGGLMGMMRGRLFEKVGVHTSTVYGVLPSEFAEQIQGAQEDPRFWASGISVIAHMVNPRIPAVHMNTRMIMTTQTWFGGGADLNPTIDEQRQRTHVDAKDFHAHLRTTCERFVAGSYERYAKWAEEYFWLPHRGEPRGVGGIFYDHLTEGDWEANFAFTRSVGVAFREIYPLLIRRHIGEAWSADEMAQQSKWRGRYVDFNLLYDRGTTFGLKTGGNVETILSSMPPCARWP